MFKSIILPLLVTTLLLLIIGYCLWLDKLEVYTNVSVASYKNPLIGSHKVFVNYYLSNYSCRDYRGVESNQVTISSDNKSIKIVFSNQSDTYNISTWIGLVISYEGVVPVRINSFQIEINGLYAAYSTEYYLYGPYKTGLGYREWGRVDSCQLPFMNYSSFITLESGWKSIAWIRISVLDASLLTSIEVTIIHNQWNNNL